MKNTKKIIVKEKFHIPQIEPEYEGLKKIKPGFEKTIAASPFYGSRVKDNIKVRDNSGQINVDKAYDAFRPKNEKHISDEELIRKYGTKYYDFQMLNEKKRQEAYGTVYEDEKPKATPAVEEPIEEPQPSFSFVEEYEPLEKPEDEATEEETKEIYEELKSSLHLDLSLDDEDIEEENDEPSIEDPKPIYKPIEKAPVNKEVSLEEEETKELEVSYDKYDDYVLPPLSIFNHSSGESDEVPEWLIQKKDIINTLLQDFDIDGEVVNYIKGPAFTRYEIMLEAGVKVNRFSALTENFQMSLGAKSIRILAPIPGKTTVGIEVPNDKTEAVYFGDIVDEDFVHDGKPLRVSLGRNIDNQVIRRTIDDMPHCLVAGATKSGKSVCMNTMLISLLIKNKPDELKLILIDPKRVELSFYEELPHLVTPVISDPEMASLGLKWAVDEMERRYDLLSEARVRNIETYNEKVKNHKINAPKMSYIVIIIDELADLMMTCSSDVEDSIKRITQKARAAGIHLIVATQRPTVDVVKGSIKANIPTRLAFRVASAVDSSTILDEGGAENLLGRGDMLIKDNNAPERVQGAFISDDEINDVCDYIREQAAPDYIFTHDDLQKQLDSQRTSGFNFGGASSHIEDDAVLYEVASFCIENGTCSINSIQGNFSFGWQRAQRIVQMLEERNIVGSKAGGTKARTVLVDQAELDRMFGKED